MKTRNLLEGIGSGLLLLFFFWRPFLVLSNLAIYHHGLPVTNLIGGLLVDLLGVATLVTGFLVAVQHLTATLQKILIAMFAGVMLWRIVDIAVIEMQINLLYWITVRKQSYIVLLLLFGALALLLPRITDPAVSVIRFLIASFGFSALWIIPQLVYPTLVKQRSQSAVLNQPSACSNSGSNRRIVWILFDELSYHQTFDHPVPGIKLPNFDRLRAESISLSNLKPSGIYTVLIIPGLFLGRRIDNIRSTIDGGLLHKDESQNRYLAYDPYATLFGLAQRNKWNTGVDGWTIPYCRILGPVLNDCSWVPALLPTEAYGATEERSMLANAAVLAGSFLPKQLSPITSFPDEHIGIFRSVMARTQSVIECNQIGFLFIHLNVPHPPGIYDRNRHMLRVGGTYLDNLVLSDDTLGALLHQIDLSPSATQTTVIVSSDHSWRIPIWKHSEFWSNEEENASGGIFDDRPVFLVHFPGQSSGSEVNSALPELLEHDIIAGMLLRKINNSTDLAGFLAQHAH